MLFFITAVLIVALVAVSIRLTYVSEVNKTLQGKADCIESIRTQFVCVSDEVTSLRIALESERKISRDAKQLADTYLSQYEDVVKKYNELVDVQHVEWIAVEQTPAVVENKKSKKTTKKSKKS